MSPRSFLNSVTIVALTLVLSARCKDDSTTSTLTRLHVTCPCDDTAYTTTLGFGSSLSSGWSPTFANIDGGGTSRSTWSTDSYTRSSESSLPSPQCFTSMSTKSNPFPTTSTKYYTSSCRVTSTTTTTTTTIKTPTPSTTTVTSSVTSTSTASATTNIATTTETDTITTTVTLTSTETDTATSTTISTPIAVFTPVDVSIPGASGPVAAKHRRNANGTDTTQNKKLNGTVPVGAISMDDLFPGDVKCYHYTTGQCSTVTSTTTTTITSTASTANPITVTATSTITVTTTPGVNTTTTFKTTETDTATTTSETTTTTTITTTLTAPAATDTAANCNSATNQAYYYNGAGVFAGGDGTQVDIVQTNATTPYDCCVSSFADPVGAAYAFALSSSICYVIESPSANCSAGQQSDPKTLTLYYQPGEATSQVLGNSACGEYTQVYEL